MHVHASYGGGEKTSRVLRISLFVTLAYIVLLVIAGLRAHSLALLSEAGHNLSDFVALLLSLVAVYLESRPPSATKTWLASGRRAGGTGQRWIAGCGRVPYFLRSVPTAAESGACTCQHHDLGSGGRRPDERSDCAAALSLEPRRQHSQRPVARDWRYG